MPLELTGERTLPGLPHEAYWFARHEVAYRWAATVVAGLPTVVDAGAGEGYGADLLSRAGAGLVVALDLDGPALTHESRTYPGVRPVRANLVALPLRTAAVDVVVSLQTVEHLWDVPGFVAECARVLRPGGRLVVSTPNRLTFSPGLARGAKPRNPFHARELDADELRDLLTAAGFTDVVMRAVLAGERLRRWEHANGLLVDAQLASEPQHWSTELRTFVASITADDFVVRHGSDLDALDLLATAMVSPRSASPAS